VVEVAVPPRKPDPRGCGGDSGAPPASGSLTELARSIDGELEVLMGTPERVEALCARLQQALRAAPAGTLHDEVLALARRLRERDGAIAAPVFGLVAEAATSWEAPWPVLREALQAREPAFVREALGIALVRARAGTLAIDDSVVGCLADLVDREGIPWSEPAVLGTIRGILTVRTDAAASPEEQLLALYLGPGPFSLRRLAARLLDVAGQPVSASIAARLLGREAHAFLSPFLVYTRAGHLDLLYLAPDGPGAGVPARVLESMRGAVEVCGESLARAVIAEVGWPRVCAGLEAGRFIGVTVGGSIPFMVRPGEAPLLEMLAGARRTGEALLIVAHGGLQAAAPELTDAGSAAARFRALNLSHATLLAEIMDVAPLDRGRIERLLGGMDRVVEDFVALFGGQAEECAILPGLYRELKGRILEMIPREGAAPQLSAELTRLVLAFEDPRTPGDVRSLHGLKRYLHQRGLRLGFHLVESGGATNRTVEILLCGSGRLLHRVPGIEYVDFEPSPGAAPGGRGNGSAIPDPVAVVVEGLGRQLLHGQRDFPTVRIFCYGNEVHYFLGYGTHPAFLRVDYSPPLLGGMVDLEFYGVSKYEMAQHPNMQLDALRLFFRRLEFDCSVEATRVRARYDKERALDLGDLRARTEALFRLVPYLMDLDWIIGGLALDADARGEVAQAWAERFALWGALPLAQMLTRDRQAILAAVDEGPAGRTEIAWNGVGPYRDRFTPSPIASDFAALHRRLRAAGLDLPARMEDCATPVGQLALERDLLQPLRDAIERGEIVLGPEGPCVRAPDQFARLSEAERFAEILAGDDRELRAAGLLARLTGPLERGLRFRTTGSLNGHEIQRAPLVLRGERLSLYVLRDAAGIVRLALCGPGEVIWRRRAGPDSPWVSSPFLEAAALSSLLRAGGYLIAGVEPPAAEPEEAVGIRARFLGAGLPSPRPPAPGERRAAGLRASPGRAAGPARFGTAGRRAEDLDGAVLLAPSVRPEDSVFLYHCAGIVSTGGGILSHAGLIATQFRKPALIVPGEWRSGEDGAPALVYRTSEYRLDEREVHGFRVSVRHDILEREHRMEEGDLVVVDADAGTMRVLGHDRDALALHDGLRTLVDLDARMEGIADDPGLLAARGRRLRARFLVEKILARLTDPVLACHAVEELLLGHPLGRGGGRQSENARLLALLVANPDVGPVAREVLGEAAAELRRRAQAALETAVQRLPTSTSLDEILALVRDVRKRHDILRGAVESLPAGGPEIPAPDEKAAAETRVAARRRLETLREEAARHVRECAGAPSPPARLRHALRGLERIERVLGEPRSALVAEARSGLARRDERAVRSIASRDVVESSECGYEAHPFVGWKAANLAEVDRLAGPGVVPAWFAVTDRAFQRVLDLPLGRTPPGLPEEAPAGATLRAAIEQVLKSPGLDSARKSARIRALWERTKIPDDLALAVAAAYRRLDRDASGAADGEGAADNADGAPAGPGKPGARTTPCFVAVRSSALEEDTELVARAGEFDTFLFVRGVDAVIDHVRRAWCGLWTERAIHHRALLGPVAGGAGGGVIVQRMVRSRASGVLQTVNSAAGDFRELVINAGLGLGEGIVSGAVAADHIVVAKAADPEAGPLRFRYTTADKREQVVFNGRSGIGTVRVESRYHERLRPALEYVDLSELVRIATRLEEAYGHPLDIEFAVEGARLWILQARPVAATPSLPFETAEIRR